MRIFLEHSSKWNMWLRFVYTSKIQGSQAVALCLLPDESEIYLIHL